MARVALAVGIVLTAVGMVAAMHDDEAESVKTLTVRDIVEKVDGKETTATAVEVTIQPGKAGVSHRHPGPGFGYILEGEYEWGIDDQPTRILKAGDTFYEPAGCLHRVSRNPGKAKTRLLAWVLHPRDVKEIVIPEPKK
ncbi:cupin domain-containing protein [Paludisphaera rhizosphaerae]|uniref:cupin domain-containing protein n=1 Tax=Paludisphaera rhizosphaerae TaxID=2711216 RepID=UPI0013EDB0D4|nr:cupin domain-containing protein [Paludisphaera rhizosphaerae]